MFVLFAVVSFGLLCFVRFAVVFVGVLCVFFVCGGFRFAVFSVCCGVCWFAVICRFAVVIFDLM